MTTLTRTVRPSVRSRALVLRLLSLISRAKREVQRGREPLWTLRVAYAGVYAAYHFGGHSKTLLFAGIPLMNWLCSDVRYKPLGKEGRLGYIAAVSGHLRHYADRHGVI